MNTTSRIALQRFEGLTSLQYILVDHELHLRHSVQWLRTLERRFARLNLAGLKFLGLQSVDFQIRKYDNIYGIVDSDGEEDDADSGQLPTAMQEWVESVERRMLGGS